MQFSREGSNRENFVAWSRSFKLYIDIFQDMSGTVWALVGRVGSKSEETEKSFQKAEWPGGVSSYVSGVIFYFYHISMYIQYGCLFWAISTLVAKCSTVIGHICLFGSEKANSFINNKCCKFVQRNYVVGMNDCIKNRWIVKIFLTQKIFAWILCVWCVKGFTVNYLNQLYWLSMCTETRN